jgi:hypothetical protein
MHEELVLSRIGRRFDMMMIFLERSVRCSVTDTVLARIDSMVRAHHVENSHGLAASLKKEF